MIDEHHSTLSKQLALASSQDNQKFGLQKLALNLQDKRAYTHQVKYRNNILNFFLMKIQLNSKHKSSGVSLLSPWPFAWQLTKFKIAKDVCWIMKTKTWGRWNSYYWKFKVRIIYNFITCHKHASVLKVISVNENLNNFIKNMFLC